MRIKGWDYDGIHSNLLTFEIGHPVERDYPRISFIN